MKKRKTEMLQLFCGRCTA